MTNQTESQRLRDAAWAADAALDAAWLAWSAASAALAAAEAAQVAAYEARAADAIKALREENERMREVLCNVQHGHVCPAQPGWLDAGPCTCGLDAALSPTASREGGV